MMIERIPTLSNLLPICTSEEALRLVQNLVFYFTNKFLNKFGFQL